jgi:hypothetical protein
MGGIGSPSSLTGLAIAQTVPGLIAPNGTTSEPNPEGLIPIDLFPNAGGGYGFGITDKRSMPEGYDHTINMTVREGRVLSPSFAVTNWTQFGNTGMPTLGRRAFCVPWIDSTGNPLVLVGLSQSTAKFQNNVLTVETTGQSSFTSGGAFFDDGNGVATFYVGQQAAPGTDKRRAAAKLAYRTQAGTWTESTTVNAKFLVSAGGALWRTTSDYQCSKCPAGSNPQTLVSWGANLYVGTADHVINCAGAIDAIPIFGATDGLWSYDEYNNRFQNIFPVPWDEENFRFLKPDGAGGLFTCSGNGDIIRLYRYGSIVSASPIGQKFPGRDTPRGVISDMVVDGDKVFAFLGAGTRVTQKDGLSFLKVTSGPTYTDYSANIIDQDYTTVATLNSLNTLANNESILIGADTPFAGVRFKMGSLNTVAGTIALSYSTGAGAFAGSPTFSINGTGYPLSAGTQAPFATDGMISWTLTTTDTTAWVKATYNSLSKYWMRIDVSAQLSAAVTVLEASIIPLRAAPTFREVTYPGSAAMDASGMLAKVLVGKFTGQTIVWNDVFTFYDVSPDGAIAVTSELTQNSARSLIVATRQNCYQIPLPFLKEPSVADFPALARDVSPHPIPVYYPSSVDLGGNWFELRYLHAAGRNFVQGSDKWCAAFRWDDTMPWNVLTQIPQEEAIWDILSESNAGRVLTTAFQIADYVPSEPVGPSGIMLRAWVKPLDIQPGTLPQVARTAIEQT